MNTKSLTTEQCTLLYLKERAKSKMFSAIYALEALQALDKSTYVDAFTSDSAATMQMLEIAIQRIEMEQSEIWGQV